jgi:lycopene beta-cyclase
MDKVFLRVLNRDPSIGESIFAAMTHGLSGDRFAGFMTDDFTGIDALRLVAALPKSPFIRAVLKNDN